MKIQRKISIADTALRHFIFNAIKFETKNFNNLQLELPKSERDDFYMNEKIHSHEGFIMASYKEALQTWFKQTPEEELAAKKRYKIICLVDSGLTKLFYCGMLYVLYCLYLMYMK